MTWARTLRRVVGFGGAGRAADGRAARGPQRRDGRRWSAPIDISPNDPLLSYFAESRGAVSLDELQLDSPGRAGAGAPRGSKLVVPLISQGELIGLLELGPRLSDQDYSREDRRLLDKLAGQAAPAVRVAARSRAGVRGPRARASRAGAARRAAHPTAIPAEARTGAPRLQFAAYYHAAREVGVTSMTSSSCRRARSRSSSATSPATASPPRSSWPRRGASSEATRRASCHRVPCSRGQMPCCMATSHRTCS